MAHDALTYCCDTLPIGCAVKNEMMRFKPRATSSVYGSEAGPVSKWLLTSKACTLSESTAEEALILSQLNAAPFAEMHLEPINDKAYHLCVKIRYSQQTICEDLVIFFRLIF